MKSALKGGGGGAIINHYKHKFLDTWHGTPVDAFHRSSMVTCWVSSSLISSSLIGCSSDVDE